MPFQIDLTASIYFSITILYQYSKPERTVLFDLNENLDENINFVNLKLRLFVRVTVNYVIWQHSYTRFFNNVTMNSIIPQSAKLIADLCRLSLLPKV